MKTCQFDQAIAAFSEAIQINPKYSKAYVSRGDANLLKGDFGSAIADFSEVLRRKSNDAEVYKAEELGHRLDSAAGRPRTNASGAKEL
jgi:tetratricopeptide (TPR) repeat protein